MNLIVPTGSAVAADRRGLPTTWLVATGFAASTSLALASRLVAGGSRATDWATAAGFVAGLLGIGGLRSLSLRATCRGLAVLSALLVMRYGSAAMEEAGGAATVIGWTAATAASLVLATASRRFGLATPLRPGRRGPWATAGRVTLAVVCLVTAAGLGVGPTAAGAFRSGTTAGERPNFSQDMVGSPLLVGDRLDATTRPQLTDQVVLRVSGDPSGFLRTQVYDRWDGSSWTRADRSVLPVPASGTVRHAATDLVPDDGEVLRQQIEVVAGFASALPVAPEATRVTAPVSLGQWTDGSVGVFRPLGEGARYRVESRRRDDLTEAGLRATAASPTPADLARRYASTPPATDRVAALADQLFTDDMTPYDKVRAVEAYLARTTRYSLDAPLSPSGSDVVDHFLFESREGWCEQIASSLTVLLRLGGVPARVAVGYVVSERDGLTGRMVVRAKDAHAWTEVWFPTVGWVPFDPTAEVPLSGRSASVSSTGIVLQVLVWVLLAVGVVASIGPWIVDVVRRRGRPRRDRRRRGGRRGARTWSTEADVVLERIGAGLGRPRAPAETSTAYGRELAALVGEPGLADAAAVIDRHRFAPGGAADADRAAADAALAAALSQPARR